jgi:hypothetical protein
MIFDIISSYHSLSKKDMHHRFRSWEHCYDFFSSHYQILKNEPFLDQGCLHLAFYLASWGMLRNSFLLQKDYKVHRYFLYEVASDPLYHHYYNSSISFQENSVVGIDKLIKMTEQIYLTNITIIHNKEAVINVTDTLASKILLGVFGNVPAYDRYFKAGLNLFGISAQFNERSLLQLVDFYHKHVDEFEKCRQLFSEEGTVYTSMKLIDMFFWQIGYWLDTPLDHLEELEKVKTMAKEFIPLVRTRSSQTGERQEGITSMTRQYIIERLNKAKADGLFSIELRSGDIHKELHFQNRMPVVCNAMESLGVYRHEIVNDTPSGMISTKLVTYYFKS